jgi:hypothetical protein
MTCWHLLPAPASDPHSFPPCQAVVLSVDLSRGRMTLSTKKLARAPGDMLRDPQLVYVGAEEMAEAYRERMEDEEREEQEGAGEEAEEEVAEGATGLEVRSGGRRKDRALLKAVGVRGRLGARKPRAICTATCDEAPQPCLLTFCCLPFLSSSRCM